MIKKLFYFVKPLIPRSFQIFLRKNIVRIQRIKYKDVWPIFRSSEVKPKTWRGWPENKKFAFVLTHDVELQGGHDKSLKLALLEKELGFVSSFNFVPERYNVSTEVRNELVQLGFEVGVHGLNHDGKLFSNKRIFAERAKKINEYIEQWNVTGFRAPAMHHNLEWIHDLNVKYDLSTFDTDPFEPQADGMKTIFPFRVIKKDSNQEYWEFPYTLVQDFTLFILMKEKNIDIWTQKLDWIAENGGMALVNVHPDYLCFDGKPGQEEFPVQHYVSLLKYVKDKYPGQFLNILPSELALKMDSLFNQNRKIIIGE
ncbi:MAG TPA: hypothetical protein VKA26_06570 [Ignavibacteriaceae bacterium]|nr:hypothetical protein [Ignavibacteriaceae bacterium]